MGKLFTNRILDVTPKERPGEPDGSVHITGLQLHHFHFLSSSPQPLGTLVPRPASPCGYPGGRRAGRGSRGAFLTSRLRGVPGVKRGPSAGQISRGERPREPALQEAGPRGRACRPGSAFRAASHHGPAQGEGWGARGGLLLARPQLPCQLLSSA